MAFRCIWSIIMQNVEVTKVSIVGKPTWRLATPSPNDFPSASHVMDSDSAWRTQIVSLVYQATCLPVLLYGCESWVLTQDMNRKINSTSCYCIMLNIKRTESPMTRHTPKRVLDHLSSLESSFSYSSWVTNSTGIQRNLSICMPCISHPLEAWQKTDKLPEIHSGTTG